MAVAAVLVMLAGAASAAVYTVGDKTGWTVMGNPDYGAWAASKKFHLGDTVGASPPPIPTCTSSFTSEHVLLAY